MAQPWSSLTGVSEVADSIEENNALLLLESRKRVTLEIDWPRRYELYNDVVGNARQWAYDPPTTGISMRAISGQIVSTGPTGDIHPDSDQLQVYERALITFEYRVVEVSSGGGGPGGQTYTAFSEQLAPSIERVPVGHRRYYFKNPSDQKRIPMEANEAPQLRLGRLTYTRTYFNWVGAVPPEYIDYQGTCNNAPIVSNFLQYTFPAETLAYVPGVITNTVATTGGSTINLSISFECQAEGFNVRYLPEARINPGSDPGFSEVFYTDKDDNEQRAVYFVPRDYSIFFF